MSTLQNPTAAHALPPTLDMNALGTARRSAEMNATANAPAKAGTAADAAWRQGVVRLLNDALATELVCVLRYKRHHFTAHGLASPRIAEEFLVHANEEIAHADRLARRIAQLGGEPDFSPDSLLRRSHAAYDESKDLQQMIRANLIAERVAVESYTQLITLVRDQDPTTRRMLEDILADEQKHAEELQSWLND
jgi:bacterioferritin